MMSKKVSNVSVKGSRAGTSERSDSESDSGILSVKSKSQKSVNSQVSHRVLSARAVARFQKNNPASSHTYNSLKVMLSKNLMSNIVKKVKQKLMERDLHGLFYYIGTFELELTHAKEKPEEYEAHLKESNEAAKKHYAK